MAAASGLSLRAVVAGATGATGQCLVGELLKAKTFEKVTVLVRRKMEVPPIYGINQEAEESSKRFDQHIVDYDELNDENGKSHFEGAHVFFCCLGTTKANASKLPGDWRENFRKVDYHLIVNLSRYAKEAGVSHVSVVSSTGAHSGSMFFYLRTKGESDDEVAKMGFERASIYRPGWLCRYGTTGFHHFAASLFRALPTENLAKAMRAEAEQFASDPSGKEKVAYLANSHIYALIREEEQKEKAAADAAAASGAAAASSAPASDDAAPASGSAAPEGESQGEAAKEEEKGTSQAAAEEAKPEGSPAAEQNDEKPQEEAAPQEEVKEDKKEEETQESEAKEEEEKKD